MKHIKIFIMTAVLVGIMFVLSGCAYYNDHFDFEFNGEYMADKYVDLLIPLEETDEFYTDYNCNIEIPENSEIVNYNKDGFRSMIMHIKESKLSISITDSEHYPASHEKYNGTPSEIRQCVNVPYYEGISDTYNTNMFLKFCNKYKKCRVAVFDKDGNIIQISKKIPLVSLGNFYLQDISYDVEKNKIKPSYIMSVEIFIILIMMVFLSIIGIIGCIITFIVYKINSYHWYKTYKGYIIAASIFNIQNVVLAAIYIYLVFGTSLSIADFFVNIFRALIKLRIFIIEIVITVPILLYFINLEKQWNLKKRLEEKHRAESLDISEKM